MTTIKSYTDLSQSKTLSEILPLESADFCYYKTGITDNWMGIPEYLFEPSPHKDYSGESIGCWSLAALINILPRFIEYKGDKYYLRFMKEYVEYANDEVSITGRCLHTTGNNNLVDACYEMILKLHEQNIL